MMDFDGWLHDTRDLQIRSFGTDPSTLRGEELADYLRWNTLAAQVELSEALAEVRWKPWATQQGRWKDRDAFVEEMVDVLHFVANMLVASGCSGVELSRRYRNKADLNRRRQEQAGGYNPEATEKCLGCLREVKESDLVAFQCPRCRD